MRSYGSTIDFDVFAENGGKSLCPTTNLKVEFQAEEELSRKEKR